MYRIRQIWLASLTNFRRWKHNPQIILTFSLAFVICFLLSNKVLLFAEQHQTILQISEPFIWTFGDADSVLIISLLLLLLFADMPSLGKETPFFLIRMDRKTWMLGQILYLIFSTMLLMSFVLLSTYILAFSKAYLANIWSDTAAILAYSEIGNQIAVPSFVKVLELSFPYECMVHIFGLMLGYSVLMASLILYLNLCHENKGMIGGIIFSGFSFLLNPNLIANLLHLPQEKMRLANIVFGWISPLNHATYYMHNFGYDNLPRLWVSYVFFITVSVILFIMSVRRFSKINFYFSGQ